MTGINLWTGLPFKFFKSLRWGGVLEKNAVYFDEFGIIQEKNMVIKDKLNITIEELTESNKNWLKEYMRN